MNAGTRAWSTTRVPLKKSLGDYRRTTQSKINDESKKTSTHTYY